MEKYFGRIDNKNVLVQIGFVENPTGSTSDIVMLNGTIDITKDIYDKFYRDPSKEDSYKFEWKNGKWVETLIKGPTSEELLEKEKKEKKENDIINLNFQREEEKKTGFEYMGYTFDSDPISLQNINGAVTRALVAKDEGDVNYTEYWITKDNQVVALDINSVIGLGKVATTFISSIYGKYRQMKDEL